MVADDERLARGGRARGDGDAGVPFRTEIPDCLALTAKDTFARVERYFEALARIRRPTDRFLAEIDVRSAYVAPLYLLTGQLTHFDDNWREVVNAYARVTSVDDPIADEALRHLRAFQFACWIVWGPSIPVCTCEYWNADRRNAVGFQLGYGDENTSVVLYDETPALRLALRRVRHRAASARRKGRPWPPPLAVEVDARVIVRRSGSVDRDRLCQAQAGVLESGAERLILEHRRLNVTTAARGRYYSAYLWVIFVLETGPGRLLVRPGEPWRAILPFFVHGNIAEASTYAFLKDRLAHEALEAIDALIRRPDTPPDVTFAYASAIDDPGCGSPPLVSDPGEPIKRTLQRLLAARFDSISVRVRVADDSANMLAEDGSYYAEFFSGCHLPETIANYFDCLKHFREGQPHGAASA